jgi:tetratricopeptide (TPR) repeat protein
VAAPADGGKAAEPMAALISKWKKAAKTRREADSFQNEGRIDRALGRLKEGLVLDPQMLELKIAAARIHVQQKEYATACDLLIDVVAADPSNDSAKIALASALSGLQQHEDALEVARWVIEGDAYNEQALRIAAAASLDVGRPGEAIGHLRRVVSVNPTDVSARNSLGMAYMKSLDFVKAAEAFAEILQGDPGNSAALYNLAVCYARQGMTDNAIAVLETAAEQFGESFVLAWTKTQDFSGLEGAAGFRSLQQRLDKSAGKPAPPSSP